MGDVIMETERCILVCMHPEQVDAISIFLKMDRSDILKWINENIHRQKEKDYSIYSVFLKDSGKYIGYCGCEDIELKGYPEVKLSWNIYKVYKEDDIDIEVAFRVRNYMFKHFDIHSLHALISIQDPLGMNIAEELDMDNEDTIKVDGQKCIVYMVSRSAKKFLASFGDGESDAVRTSIQNRRASLNPAARFKSPKLRPS